MKPLHVPELTREELREMFEMRHQSLIVAMVLGTHLQSRESLKVLLLAVRGVAHVQFQGEPAEPFVAVYVSNRGHGLINPESFDLILDLVKLPTRLAVKIEMHNGRAPT